MKKQICFNLLFPAFLILLLLFSFPAHATGVSATQIIGPTWNFDSATGTLTISGTGELADYPYLSALERQAPWKKWADDIKTVVIAEGITGTGECTFHMLKNLTQIQLPSTLKTIGNNAFSGTVSLKEIVIPANVTFIDDSAFNGCTALQSVNIPNGVTEIGNRAFNECKELRSVVIPASVETIELYAFHDCTNLTDVIFAGAPNIDTEAFASCNNLRILRFCGNPPTFADNSLQYVDAECYYPKNSTAWTASVMKEYGGVLDWFASDDPARAEFSKFEDTKSGKCGSNATWSLTGGVLTISGSGTMDTVRWSRYGQEIQKVIVKDGITSVASGAFCGFENLKSAVIPNSVTDIGSNVFYGCSSLSSVTLSANLTLLPWYSFTDCTSLKEITIPNGVTEIGEFAFWSAGLEKVTLPTSLTEIEQGAFGLCKKLKEIRFPASLEKLGEQCFVGCSSLKTLYFEGDPPKFYNFTFSGITATAYYPEGNLLWKQPGAVFHNCDIHRVAYTASKDCVNHVFGDWGVTFEPTIETSGQKERICTLCGYKQVASIPRLEKEDAVEPPVSQPEDPDPPKSEPVTDQPNEDEPLSAPVTKPMPDDPTETTNPVENTPVSKSNLTAWIVGIVVGLGVASGGVVLFFLRKRK